MKCPKCGFVNVDTAKRCACGIDLTTPDEPTMGFFDEKKSLSLVRLVRLVAIIAGLMNCWAVFTGSHEAWPGNSIINAAIFLGNAAVYFGMAYGLYRKSRTCAILLFIWNIGEPLDVYSEGTTPFTVPLILRYVIVASIYLVGIFATFALHKFEKDKREEEVLFTPEASVDAQKPLSADAAEDK